MTDKPEGVTAKIWEDTMSGRRDWAPFLEYPPPPSYPDHLTAPQPPWEREVGERHAKVSEIIARGLARIGHEISELDPDTRLGDNAADRAEIARQVLTQLMFQLRGFSAETRRKIAAEKDEDEAA